MNNYIFKYFKIFCPTLFILTASCYDCKKVNEITRKGYLIGTVDSTYRDVSNRGHPIITLKFIKNDLKIIWIDGSELFELYNLSENGDTIIKERNSLQYKLIKKDTVMYFYPICGCCDTIK
jgi:hypothetical protein